jgi:hypothetical protein
MPTSASGYLIRCLAAASDGLNTAAFPPQLSSMAQGLGCQAGFPVLGPNWQVYRSSAGSIPIAVTAEIISGTSAPTTARGLLNVRTTAQP